MGAYTTMELMILFWTKVPHPIIFRIKGLKGYWIQAFSGKRKTIREVKLLSNKRNRKRNSKIVLTFLFIDHKVKVSLKQ